jgi:DNA-3-methyladenine glycosylase
VPYRIKRIYDPPAPEDGFRVLVDRLWPRGVTKQRAALDLWLKEVAPSTELRTWFHARPDGFDEFADRYRAELAANPAVDELRAVAKAHPAVTLLYSVKDPERNHAAVLADYLRR